MICIACLLVTGGGAKKFSLSSSSSGWKAISSLKHVVVLELSLEKRSHSFGLKDLKLEGEVGVSFGSE
jgi:hypothetical protein